MGASWEVMELWPPTQVNERCDNAVAQESDVLKPSCLRLDQQSSNLEEEIIHTPRPDHCLLKTNWYPATLKAGATCRRGKPDRHPKNGAN